MARHAAQDEEVGQDVDHVRRLELAGDPDRQALARVLVDDVEHPELPPVMGAVLDEVVGPDVVRMLGPQPDAGAVRQPEPAALGLLLGTFSPSRRQIRSTRLSLTTQPAVERSSSAILR